MTRNASTILVTGAAGFIGSHLVDHLLARGDRVIGLDNFDDFYDVTIKRENLCEAARHPRFRLVEGDIRDLEPLAALLQQEQVDQIVHLAARAGVRPSVIDPELYVDVNVRGTTSVFEAAHRSGVRKVVFASSSSVYGGNEKVPFSETDSVDSPISPYAATKKACELVAFTFHHLYDIDAIGLRFFTVYGPRQRPEMAIHKFAQLIDEGKTVPRFGDGSTRRDYTFIDDCIQGVLAAIDGPSGYRIFNLGNAATTTLNELIELIGQAIGVTPKIRELPLQPGDVSITYADIERARAELGYDPSVPVRDGVARFASWFLARQSTR